MSRDEMNFEQKMYENKDLWKRENISVLDERRIKMTVGMIPKDVKSVLDVGCGGGILVNYLKSNFQFERVCGMDRSNAAIEQVLTEKRVGNVDALPFENGEFDLVSSLEVIEHLPNDVYRKALQEMARVSKKYVLISVPFAEDLASNFVSCPECFSKFHPSLHLKSFKEQDMRQLMADQRLECIEIKHIEQLSKVIGFKVVKRALDFYFKMPRTSICPVCGYRPPDQSRTQAGQPVESGFLNVIRAAWPKRKSYIWIAALYKKSPS